MFIHFQLQWIGCNQTWHHDAAAPCNWITLRLLENRWTLQPGRMARHLDAMGCTRCNMANGQMVLHDAQNLHMLHNMCYSVLGRSDSELVSVVSVLRLAKQIFCLRISFGVSIRYCPACRCDSLRLDRHSNLPDAACQLVMLVDSKDAAWSSLSSFTKPILRSAMQSGAYNSRRRNHLQHSES